MCKRDGPHKRQPGRYPRIPFTIQQIAILEDKFEQNPYLGSQEAVDLSRKLQLGVVKIKIWFQNRRARKRREELGEFSKEKSSNIHTSNEEFASNHTCEKRCLEEHGTTPINYP